MKRVLVPLMLLLSLALVSCGGGGGGGGGYTGPTSYPPVSYAYDFIDMMNENMPWDADDSYIVKNGTEQAYYIVVYDDLLDTYMAYSLEYYVPGMSWSEYQDELDWWGVDSFSVDPYGSDIYGNQAYRGNVGYGWVYFEDTANSPKDLEAIGAVKDNLSVNTMAGYFESIGLNAKRAQDVAKATHNLKAVANSRALTDADANSFAKDIIAHDVEKYRAAYIAKLDDPKSKDLDNLMEDARVKNGFRDTEDMNDFITAFLNK